MRFLLRCLEWAAVPFMLVVIAFWLMEDLVLSRKLGGFGDEDL